MFCSDDEDVQSKTPVVRPNDVIDLEISPQTRQKATSWLEGFDKKKSKLKTSPPPKASVKEKKQKSSRAPVSSSAGKKTPRSPMKRGDPFLPSVISDESPFADYSVKKNSRKKPADCKCKGLAYNLSPSALLPEEMRQPWGVGVFGKTVSIQHACMPSPRSHGLALAPLLEGSENEIIPSQPSANSFKSSTTRRCDAIDTNYVVNCTSLKCKGCKNELCTCSSPLVNREAFRMQENHDVRRHKASVKAGHGKTKENKIQITSSGKGSKPMLKRIACYNSKDNSNIISTSNFNRNNSNCTPVGGYNSMPYDSNASFRAILCGSHVSAAGSRGPSFRDSSLTSKSYGMSHRVASEGIHITPRSRYRHPLRSSRRLLTNTSLSTIPTSGEMKSSPILFERGKAMPRSASADMLMMAPHKCSCDSCRRRARLVSRMEALGFSNPNTQRMAPPFVFSANQRYQSSPMQSSTPLGRYSPYSPTQYSYQRTSTRLYCPPDVYESESPPLEYSFPPGTRNELPSGEPLAQAMRQMDSSPFLDNETMSASPFMASEGGIEDITDLSIKDTVDFFVKMKSPISAPPMTAAAQPTSEGSGSFSSFFVDESSVSSSPTDFSRATSFTSASGYFPKRSFSGGLVASSGPYRRESSKGVQAHRYRYSSSAWPRDIFYSSLVSDLEDELRCAIENIPTE